MERAPWRADGEVRIVVTAPDGWTVLRRTATRFQYDAATGAALCSAEDLDGVKPRVEVEIDDTTSAIELLRSMFHLSHAGPVD